MLKNKSNKQVFYLVFQLAFLLLLFFFCLNFWLWLIHRINQPIVKINIHANLKYVTTEKIKNTIDPYLKNRFLNINIKNIHDSLKSLPWVRFVVIKKHWPDILDITLEEQNIVARWKEGFLITDHAEIIKTQSTEKFKDLPKLSGARHNVFSLMRQYLTLQYLLKPYGLSLEQIQLDSLGIWSVYIKNVLVVLGKTQASIRIKKFLKLYQAQLENQWNNVKRVDMRYLDAAAVAWHKNKT